MLIELTVYNNQELKTSYKKCVNRDITVLQHVEDPYLMILQISDKARDKMGFKWIAAYYKLCYIIKGSVRKNQSQHS